MTSVLLLNMGADTGGVLISYVRAFRDEPGWDVRSLVSSTNYIGYEPDLHWDDPTLKQSWNAADVVHLHHDMVAAERLTGGWKRWMLPAKPYVLTFHGTGFREEPNKHLRQMRQFRAVGVCSTLDLVLLAPDELEWAPPAVNVEMLQAMKRPSTDTVRIAHAPTNRQIKSTALLIEAVEHLKAEGFPAELDLIERVPWTECLARKAKADIYFDQVILGYGCNALEAWGMGIPVIAGASDETLDEMERRFGHLPFYHATEETIYDALKELVESPELREQYGRIGYEYVKAYHDEPVVVEQLKRLYRRALGVMEEAA